MSVDSNVRTWATAISTHPDNGKKVIFRYADELSLAFDPASQPVRIIIVWKYQSESGLPVTEDNQRMNALEDTLEAVLKDSGFATLALVSTGEGLREWTYYAKSEDEFMARLNYAFAEIPKFPIEIHQAHDPGWELWDRFKAGVRKTAP